MSRWKKDNKKALYDSKDLNVYEGCPFCMCMIIAFSVSGHGVLGIWGVLLYLTLFIASAAFFW